MNKKLKIFLIIVVLIFLFIRFNCYITQQYSVIVLGISPIIEKSEEIVIERVKLVGCQNETIIFSGIEPESDILEKKWRELNPTCESRIIIEDKSISTWQNARNTLNILKSINETKATITTSSCHIGWAKISFYVNRIFIYPSIELDFKS